MELHKALKHIIKAEGKGIVTETRLVNILNDMNAYQEMPAFKYILRAIIADGYTEKLLIISRWDTKAEQLAIKFAALTGFIPDFVNRIFLSLAYGMEWINESTIKAYNNTCVNQNIVFADQSLMHPLKPILWNNNMTQEEKEQLLLSLIEYDNSKEKVNNVRFDNISFDVDENEWVTIHGEIIRIKKIPVDTYPWLRYALYDLKGRMKDTGSLQNMTNADISPKPVSTLWYKLKASDISRIRLFWVDD